MSDAQRHADRVRAAHAAVAAAALENDEFFPIFERLEVDLIEAEAAALKDPIAAARARLAAQRAML